LEFMDVVRRRRSIRKYRADEVPKADVEYMLEAARLAPSWANRQCWRYIVVTDEATRRRITVTEWAAKAPVVIVACADPTKA
jgi:nitroreductase